MRKPTLTAAQFKALHDKAVSNEQARLWTGLSPSAYSMRVSRYRKMGIELRKLNDRKIDVEKVNRGEA